MTIEDHVSAVKAMEEDARVTVIQLVHNLLISLESVVIILHEKLRYSKACDCWVPHMLTEE